MRRACAALVALVVLLGVAVAAQTALRALDLTGTWKGFSGTLTLEQSGSALTGTFLMAIGCTETYTVTGSLSGSTVSLALTRANGLGDAPPCAGSQTLNGSATATSLRLALVNSFQSSPPTAFARQGAAPGVTTTATRPTTTTAPPAAGCLRTKGAIAFTSVRDGNGEIYVMNADGSGQARCTKSAGFDGQAAWAPDGSALAIRSDRSGNADIWLLPIAADSPPRNLTANPALDENPSWSPDGARIVFSSNRGGDVELWVLTVRTGLVRRLTTSPGYDGDPAWSPDGRQIAWERGSITRGLDLWVMNADGTGAKRLTSTPGYFNLDPAWTPDSRRIVINSSRTGANEIWILNADGSAQRQLTRNTFADALPTVSPSGERIAFTSEKNGGKSEIYAMNADGSAWTRLTSNPAIDEGPDWRRR